MKILLIDQPLKNRGDESAHRGLIATILNQYPNAQITVVENGKTWLDTDIAEFIVEDNRVSYVRVFPSETRSSLLKRRILSRLMPLGFTFLFKLDPQFRVMRQYYLKADIVMCAPGGINLGGFMDWSHLRLLYFAKMTNKKLVYFARSIGPFSNETYRQKSFKRLAISILKYCSFVSLRDEKSQNTAKQLGIKFTPTVDSAFLVDSPNYIPSCIEESLNINDFIVVVPNSLVWHHNFKHLTIEYIIKFWVDLINALSKEHPNAQIVMLPQTMGDYSGWKNPEGEKLFNIIKTNCSVPNSIFVLDEKYGSDIQQSIIKKAKFLIGARYHSIIFAINQTTPFISLSYEHKMTGILKSLNIKDCEVIIDDLLSKGSYEEGINAIVKMSRNLKPNEDAKQLSREISLTAFRSLEI